MRGQTNVILSYALFFIQFLLYKGEGWSKTELIHERFLKVKFASWKISRVKTKIPDVFQKLFSILFSKEFKGSNERNESLNTNFSDRFRTIV